MLVGRLWFTLMKLSVIIRKLHGVILLFLRCTSGDFLGCVAVNVSVGPEGLGRAKVEGVGERVED